jgi:hypothetical protein
MQVGSPPTASGSHHPRAGPPTGPERAPEWALASEQARASSVQAATELEQAAAKGSVRGPAPPGAQRFFAEGATAGRHTRRRHRSGSRGGRTGRRARPHPSGPPQRPRRPRRRALLSSRAASRRGSTRPCSRRLSRSSPRIRTSARIPRTSPPRLQARGPPVAPRLRRRYLGAARRRRGCRRGRTPGGSPRRPARPRRRRSAARREPRRRAR